MRIRLPKMFVSALGLAVLSVGCLKATPPPSPLETLVRVHWAGTASVAGDPNATNVLEIWALPESVKLREQSLDRLAMAPWTLLNSPADTNAIAQLRPLLEDMLRQGCRLEVAQATNQSLAFAVALQLSAERAAVWETNLALVANTLIGTKPLPMTGNRSGWRVEAGAARNATAEAGRPVFVGFLRAGEWTVTGAAPSEAAFDELAGRILKIQTPTPQTTNLWLAATLDLPGLAAHLPWLSLVQEALPQAEVVVRGENGKVRTEATFQFEHPLHLTPDEWHVPTNLIDQPLATFSAARGLDGLLSNSPAWRKLDLGPPPDQLVVWAFQGQLMQSFFAAQHPEPASLVARATRKILPGGQAWLNEEWTAGFKKPVEGDGVEWQGLPYMWPFIRSVATNGHQYVLGGAFAYAAVMYPLSSEFYEEALAPDDLLYYGWERSDHRLGHWLFMGQFARYVSGVAQMPFESASVLWLKALESKLGDSVTRLTWNRPDQLRLTRSSSLGLTAIELHLLGDWLESPKFPTGLHTTQATPPPLPKYEAEPTGTAPTNAPAAQEQ